jgi:segregation and condensation protein B
MEREDLKSILESLLFVADGPVPVQRFCEIVDGASKDEVSAALAELQSDLDGSSRGVHLVEVAGGFQMRTVRANADWVKKFLGGRPARMSRATLETLAIIAYRQPLTGPEITELRGAQSTTVIKTLLERRMIRIAGRKQVVGKPFLYATTREFLLHFGLGTLGDLPPLEEMEELFSMEGGGEAPIVDREEELARESAALDDAAASDADTDDESEPTRAEIHEELREEAVEEAVAATEAAD